MQLQATLLALMAAAALAAPNDLEARDYKLNCKRGRLVADGVVYTVGCSTQAKLTNYLYSHIGDSTSIGECAEFCNTVDECHAVVYKSVDFQCDIYGAGAKVKSTKPNGAYDYAIQK